MAGRVYVGNIALSVTERDLEDEFSRFGYLRSVWVARKPPGFAFIEFEDARDADDAIRKLDGLHGWRVESSRKGERGGGGPRGRYGGGGGGSGGYGRGPPPGSRELRCYECGEIGHLASDCRATGGRSARRYDDRYKERSRSPVRRRSPAYDAPARSRRSPSYASRSPPRRSRS